MNIIQKFFNSKQKGNHQQALAQMEEILRRDPSIATSWYNYGDCLEKVGRPGDAASAFLEAVNRNPEDGGAYFRACLALVDAGDTARLLDVFRRICTADPAMLPEIMAQPEFAAYFQRPEFQQLAKEFSR